MIDRGEVERLLTNWDSMQRVPVLAPGAIVELLRCRLAVLDAPVAMVDSAGCLYGDDRRIGDLANQRVRLVRVQEG